MDFQLTEDQRAIQDMASAFAADRVAPHALEWDKAKHFPADIVRETGPLGFGGIYVREDVGGSGLGRLDAVLIFEALARACPSGTTCPISPISLASAAVMCRPVRRMSAAIVYGICRTSRTAEPPMG